MPQISNPSDEPYKMLDLTPEQTKAMDEVGQARLHLPSKYVERMHVSGLLWKYQCMAREDEQSGSVQTVMDVLKRLDDELQKMPGINP